MPAQWPTADDGAGRAPLTVVDRIKQYILVNRLSPGDPMPTEHELSDQLAVSRSRIREAMKTLSALDIVEVRHGYGTFVGTLSLTGLAESLAFRGMLTSHRDKHFLADLIDLRELLEIDWAPLIVERLDAGTIAAMRALATTMVDLAAQGREFPVEDRQFHQLLVSTSGNALVGQLLDVFWQVHSLVSETLGPASLLPETAQAHHAILDAIETGSAAALEAAIREHYQPIRERMLRSTAGTAD
ncbi:transcriptional regulator [Tersicoccus solisilvae]|uniref:Transcriptional regulator n=1 Tax=Tersicoccus solisilvae TaxID=1882339 RepID=A0ABQ1NPD8_9MICC|nr:FadR/GntR family transcriptional regulator [Tersicoccus solisilvae]GGC82180.1 transcriptional regulator [Tersicoccus solisilvae]